MSEFKIDQNVTLTKLFDNNVLILMNEIELSNQYTPKEQLFIHCSFLEIKRLISRNYFIDKFNFPNFLLLCYSFWRHYRTLKIWTFSTIHC